MAIHANSTPAPARPLLRPGVTPSRPLLPSAEPRQQLGLGVLVLPLSGLTLAHAAAGAFVFKGGRDA